MFVSAHKKKPHIRIQKLSVNIQNCFDAKVKLEYNETHLFAPLPGTLQAQELVVCLAKMQM
jgi:hypothetical protein